MKSYGGIIMPSVESVKKDLEALGTTGQEYSYTKSQRELGIFFEFLLV
jgi:hypothetical protein